MRELLERKGFRVLSDRGLKQVSDGFELPDEADGSPRNGRIVLALRR